MVVQKWIKYFFPFLQKNNIVLQNMNLSFFCEAIGIKIIEHKKMEAWVVKLGLLIFVSFRQTFKAKYLFHSNWINFFSIPDTVHNLYQLQLFSTS